VSFLASPDSQRITGTKVIVDGGMVNCESHRKYSAQVAKPGGTGSGAPSAG